MIQDPSIHGMNQRQEPFSSSILDPNEYRENPFEDYFNIFQQRSLSAGFMPQTHRFDQELGRAARRALASEGNAESFETNV